jgi:hypothetical protein
MPETSQLSSITYLYNLAVVECYQLFILSIFCCWHLLLNLCAAFHSASRLSPVNICQTGPVCHRVLHTGGITLRSLVWYTQESDAIAQCKHVKEQFTCRQ